MNDADTKKGEEGTVRTTITLSDDLYRKVRLVTADAGQTIQKTMADAVREVVEREYRKIDLKVGE